MVVRQKQRYGLALAEGKCAQIQRYGILLMTVVVLFFVLSCVLSLSPQQLAEAKAQNLSILSYLGQSVRYTDYCLAIADYRLCRYY